MTNGAMRGRKGDQNPSGGFWYGFHRVVFAKVRDQMTDDIFKDLRGSIAGSLTTDTRSPISRRLITGKARALAQHPPTPPPPYDSLPRPQVTASSSIVSTVRGLAKRMSNSHLSVDEKTGLSVILIDTPGFNDSHEGVTDTDILEKIMCFLEPEKGERRKLNGIIYMHRISDPRVGGVSRKNLRMFHSLCGDANLKNVRIVTTNWARVSKEEGDKWEEALQTGAFKALLDAQAGMRRHLNTVESAQVIIHDADPAQAGSRHDAGKYARRDVLTAEMREMQKMHEKELAGLKRGMEEAAKANDLALRAELAEERRALEQKMARAEEDGACRRRWRVPKKMARAEEDGACRRRWRVPKKMARAEEDGACRRRWRVPKKMARAEEDGALSFVQDLDC
ncbi:hypothetical protein L210DRAFT_3507997 [Boletus edulis BED1]|uniref:G domain-containing protein n=1 Tax=Boletus edulis BED1 TaxID=1328754 RepID=A0AAD4G9Y3_BOLED|nr:hypothetical protein L210DRAFT_3507997 [Boletus edulis BED1]